MWNSSIIMQLCKSKAQLFCEIHEQSIRTRIHIHLLHNFTWSKETAKPKINFIHLNGPWAWTKIKVHTKLLGPKSCVCTRSTGKLSPAVSEPSSLQPCALHIFFFLYFLPKVFGKIKECLFLKVVFVDLDGTLNFLFTLFNLFKYHYQSIFTFILWT